jgi:malto-oligosyltrehalose synthase
VQLSKRFTLDDLAAQVPYLAQLGVSHVYLSPIYAARPDSPHCYDIVDYGCINRELGGPPAWQRLCETLRNHELRVILDVVPNHMAADPVNNMLWRRVLRDGPDSEAAKFFDIDWRPLTGFVRDKVLLPFLEEPYGQALTRGTVHLEQAGGELRVGCCGLHLPLSSCSVEALRLGAPPGEGVDAINRNPDRLHELLEQQHYRLAYWRPANDEINYRRFFGVNELIAIHAEDGEVFAKSHSLILKLAAEDVVDGVRVDHVDGLLDPVGYLHQLRAALETSSSRRPWIVVEKVLDPAEPLDSEWPVDGTTGYEALDALNRLFLSGRGVRILRRFFQRLVDERLSFREEALRSKRLIMHGALLSGMTMLAHELKRVADGSWTTRDIALNSLQEALVEFIAALPVYRTYLGTGPDRPVEQQVVIESLESAERRNPAMDASAFAFLRSLLLGEQVDDAALAARRAAIVKRLQQYTSGVQAKGVEDTAFYRDNTLLAMNEVGGNPGDPAMSIREFHRFNVHRAEAWPDSMTATSTHDTKLSEDARIRIGTLSVFAREWTEAVRRWRTMTAPYRRTTRRGACPDVRDEYRFYQVLVGVWNDADVDQDAHVSSDLVERLVAYMRKATREAQLNSSWIRPDLDYENALETFVRQALSHEDGMDFCRSVASFVDLISPVSTCHAISQLVIKCLMPGVPDFYQGTEDWTFTLTDPDNRRPVDFGRHAEQLGGIWQSSDEGRQHVKMRITTALLQFRNDHDRLLREAGYRPLRVRGLRSTSIVAFERRGGTSRVVVAVPRLTTPSSMPGGCVGEAFWGDTEIRLPLSSAPWTNILDSHDVVLERPWCRMAELASTRPWVVLYRARLRPGRSRLL